MSTSTAHRTTTQAGGESACLHGLLSKQKSEPWITVGTVRSADPPRCVVQHFTAPFRPATRLSLGVGTAVGKTTCDARVGVFLTPAVQTPNDVIARKHSLLITPNRVFKTPTASSLLISNLN